MALVVAVTGCGSDADGADRTEAPSPSVASPTRVADRWEEVTRFGGEGSQQTASFDIAGYAIEWRVTASCTTGALAVRLPADAKPLVAHNCPGRSFGFSIRAGATVLDVTATGSWAIVVHQKVNIPISEPRLADMTEKTRLAGGRFYGIDQEGSGTVELYRLPDGRRALRFEPFQVTANTDLFVWLSAAEEPTTSKAAFTTDHAQIHELKATAGPQNYLVPADVPTDLMKSVVIWCEPVRTAYAAASLSR